MRAVFWRCLKYMRGRRTGGRTRTTLTYLRPARVTDLFPLRGGGPTYNLHAIHTAAVIRRQWPHLPLAPHVRVPPTKNKKKKIVEKKHRSFCIKRTSGRLLKPPPRAYVSAPCARPIFCFVSPDDAAHSWDYSRTDVVVGIAPSMPFSPGKIAIVR